MKNLALISNRKNLILITLVLLFAAITHGFNMFHFPYYENDEGAYLSQAWSLLRLGELAPYTYWYDHAPAGWIFIAIWTVLTGGFFTFGTSVDSGRVFMLVIHVLSTLLLLLLSKRLSGNYFAGIIATIIFSLSPLAIYFQRRVLLDNLMIFWILLSLWLLVKERFSLRNVYLSALAFGIAVLTKENAIFFLPAFLYVVYTRAHTFHKRFAIAKWLAISTAFISLYFIFALLKTELLPVGTFDTSIDRVSLISTLEQQSSRGVSFPFWDQRSEFITNMMNWVSKDSTVVILAVASTLLGALLSIKVKMLRIPVLFTLSFWLFLMRGKLVIEFYIIPLIPLIALQTGLIADSLITLFKRIPYAHALLQVLCISAFIFLFLQNPLNHFKNDETTAHRKTLAWIKENLPSSTIIVIDGSMYVDLHEKKSENDTIFPNAHWYWKVDYDKEITDDVLKNNWSSIEYIALSHEMLKQIKLGTQTLPKYALNNSSQILDTWSNPNHSDRSIPTYESFNGDWMSVYKTDAKDKIILNTSWDYYKKNFIHSYGQVINPVTKTTTVNDQSTSMLRALWVHDYNAFNGLWSWTKDHLQHRTNDNLLSHAWSANHVTSSEPEITENAGAAFVLLLAYELWGDQMYLADAREMLDDLYPRRNEIASLSPVAYTLFSQYDENHTWQVESNNNSTTAIAANSTCFSNVMNSALTNLIQPDTIITANSEPNNTTSISDRIAYLRLTNPQQAKNVYQESLEKPFNYTIGTWNGKTNYDLLSCGWLGVVIANNMTLTVK